MVPYNICFTTVARITIYSNFLFTFLYPPPTPLNVSIKILGAVSYLMGGSGYLVHIGLKIDLFGLSISVSETNS